MKNNTKKIMVALLVLFVAAAGVFAAAVREEAAETVSLESLDLSSASFEQIMETFAKSQESYQRKYESIYNKMVDFYKAGEVDNYFDAKGMLRNLEYPAITAEQTEVLVSRLVDEQDASKKESFSEWLYQNSRYYRPAITFSRSSADEGEGRSYRYSFSYSISAKPGSTVTLPDAAMKFTEDGLFAGWGNAEGELLYEAGQEIEMPYGNLALYPVYKQGVLFVDTVTGTEVFEDGSEINAPVLEAPDETYVFLGWYDAEGNKADGTAALAEGESAVYTARWVSIAVKDVAIKHSKDLTVNAGEKEKLSFSVKNNGNVNAGSLTIEIVPEKEGTIENLSGKLTASGLRAGQTKTGTFSITVSGNSGDVVNANVVVKDAEGNEWKVPVKLTVK